MDFFEALESALNRLGRHFLLGRKNIFQRAQDALRQASAGYASLREENGELSKSLAEKSSKLRNTETDLANSREENSELSKSLAEKNSKLRNFDLVSNALAAKPVENRFISQFEELIQEEFVRFCKSEPGMPDNISLERRLRQILKDMRLIANCPNLYSKNLGSVGGGFSSGKSSFLNSFLAGSKIRLAEGIRPVTAIPSYVISGEEAKIQGITYKGGCFDIGLDMYKAISHELLKSFSFNLKEIILYTTVLAPMETSLFENLCLIDTPGYNPPSSGTMEKDFETAGEYIKDARFLIWMVGLDSNGTIPQSDLDFLEKLEFGKGEDRHLYIVANKAETKTEEDIADILDVFEECLDDRDLRYAGISAYSSKTKKVYASRKKEIREFLAEHNKPSNRYEALTAVLEEVFAAYLAWIREDFNEKESKRKEVKRLKLVALESGLNIDDSSNALEAGLEELAKYFKSDETLEQRLDRAKNIRELFKGCLDGFCAEMGIEPVKADIRKAAGQAVAKPADIQAAGYAAAGSSTEKGWLAGLLRLFERH